MQESSAYWRHPRFRDLGLMTARFTRHRYDRHTHETYVVALITEGCERIRIGNRDVLAPAGTVAVVNPEEWHDGEAGAESGWAYRTFYPSVELMQAVAGEIGRGGAPIFAPGIIEDAPLAQALASAHKDAGAEDATQAETSMLLALRHLILRHATAGAPAEALTTSGAQRRMALYEGIIEENLASELELQRFAEAAGVTRFQVIRDFRKVAGVTPAAFIRDRRMRCADRLINQGSSLADAAFDAGFADQSHLSRTFRAMHGMTPGMFKRAG